MALTTFDRVADEIKGTFEGQTATTPQQVMGYIRTVSRRIESFGYDFEPRYDALPITPCEENVNTYKGILSLPAPLLEARSIVVGGVSVIYGTDILPYPNANQSPVRELRIAKIDGSGPIKSWYPANIRLYPPIEQIVISGFWGTRTRYGSEGFFDSAVTCPVMTDSQLQIVVSDVAGADAYGRTPRFSPGNLLRIEDELAEVIDVATSTKTLTLRRGLRGTAAATHAAGQPIRIWEPEYDIVTCATRQAALLYARRGSYQEVTSFPEGVNVRYPSDLLAEVRATVQLFDYLKES